MPNAGCHYLGKVALQQSTRQAHIEPGPRGRPAGPGVSSPVLRSLVPSDPGFASSPRPGPRTSGSFRQRFPQRLRARSQPGNGGLQPSAPDPFLSQPARFTHADAAVFRCPFAASVLRDPNVAARSLIRSPPPTLPSIHITHFPLYRILPVTRFSRLDLSLCLDQVPRSASSLDVPQRSELVQQLGV